MTITPAMLHSSLPMDSNPRIRGTVVAGRLVGMHAYISGQLKVEHELRDCRLDVQGEVVAPKALVVDSVLAVCGQATIGTLGSADAHTTHIAIGTLAVHRALRASIAQQIRQIEQRIARTDASLARFDDKQRAGAMTAADRDARTAIICGMKPELDEKHRHLVDTREKVDAISTNGEPSRLAVDRIHPGTILAGTRSRVRMTALLDRPVSIRADETSGAWTVLERDTGTPLDLLDFAEVEDIPPSAVAA